MGGGGAINGQNSLRKNSVWVAWMYLNLLVYSAESSTDPISFSVHKRDVQNFAKIQMNFFFFFSQAVRPFIVKLCICLFLDPDSVWNVIET